MARTPWKVDDFTEDGDFVVLRRDLRLGDGLLVPGSIFPKHLVTTRRLRQLYEHRGIGRPDGFVPQPKNAKRKIDNNAIIQSTLRAAYDRDVAEGRIKPMQANGSSPGALDAGFAEAEEHVAAPVEAPMATPAIETSPVPAPSYGAADMGLAATPPVEVVPVPNADGDHLGRGKAARKRAGVGRQRQRVTAG